MYIAVIPDLSSDVAVMIPNRKEIPKMKKAAMLAILLLCLAPFAQATCNLDLIDEGIPPFHVGTPGSFTLSACCGTPPYTFSIQSGTMPAGLSFSSGGTISGTPTTVTTDHIVCFTVTDAAGCHLTRCYYIEVD